MQLGFSSLADSNQSNDCQKVQYNTDLLKQRHKYLYRLGDVKLLMKWNDIVGEGSGELRRQFVFNLRVVFNLRNGLMK
jgi:hypothetical protein